MPSICDERATSPIRFKSTIQFRAAVRRITGTHFQRAAYEVQIQLPRSPYSSRHRAGGRGQISSVDASACRPDAFKAAELQSKMVVLSFREKR
jgi:hypothetical protein